MRNEKFKPCTIRGALAAFISARSWIFGLGIVHTGVFLVHLSVIFQDGIGSCFLNIWHDLLYYHQDEGFNLYAVFLCRRKISGPLIDRKSVV